MIKKKLNEKYTVIIDTREKIPIDFSKDENTKEVIYKKLETADYTIKGAEDILAIERKKSTSELSQNLLDERFFRELVRLQEFEYPFILCQFSLSDILYFPNNSGIPKTQWSKIKVTGDFLLKNFISMTTTYKIPVIFCDNNYGMFKTCTSIFRKIHKEINE